MTADEAKELVEEHNQGERGGIFFKLKLAWKCGVINETIKAAAKNGETDVRFEFDSEEKKYIKPLITIYTKQGYKAKANIGFYLSWLTISWD